MNDKTPTSKKVMIIEDEKDLFYLLSSVLRKNNFYAQCARSLTEARRLINYIKPSIIFLDNHLPDGYGSDFIGVIKILFPQTKIIMITAYDSPVDINLAFTNGADYFIAKPFSATAIKSALDMVNMNVPKSAVSSLTS